MRYALFLTNTETRRKEEIVPYDGQTVRLYTCGPTVYHFAHIGNFRTYVCEDLLRRTLKFFGYRVKQAMNLTDVEDKTIQGAMEQGISLDAFTRQYKQAFSEDLKVLNCEPVEYNPQATDYVEQMVAMIQKLLHKGVAYRDGEGNVYFSLQKFPRYGRLSHLKLDALKHGASSRIAIDEYDKEQVSDFVLWKSYDPARDGDVYWETSLGKGRPGWHIECSAMATKLLGETIDIHAGGVDNIFPHHENEIAQSESATGRPFVRHWMHIEHLLVDHKKMSKSAGNFYTLRDLLARGYTGREMRLLLLQVHYRIQLNFTLQALDAAKHAIERLADFIRRLKALRREKIHSALNLILENALPRSPEGLSIRQRVLYDLKAVPDRELFEPNVLEPILQRILPHNKEKMKILQDILERAKEERNAGILHPILAKVLGPSSKYAELTASIVRDLKERDIFDPHALRPILAKSLPARGVSGATVKILHGLKNKKDQGFVLPLLERAMRTFMEHLADDLNISPALAALFDVVREVNQLCDAGKIGLGEAEEVLDFLRRIDQVLGVLPLEQEEIPLESDLEEALAQREQARKEKQWERADAFREFIASRGYLVEDTPQGPRLKKM